MDHSVDFSAIRHRFVAAIASAVGFDPSTFDRPGTIVVASEERRGRGTAVVNAIGPHSLIWCDPLVVDRVADLTSDSTAFPVAGVERWAPSVGATFVGGARSLLVDAAMLIVPGLPEGGRLVVLDATDARDRALIAGLLQVTDPDDADAAEMEMDALDPHIVGLVDGTGTLAAIASERPWEYDPAFGNIGVLVRDDRRHGGWGRAAVAVLAAEVLEGGRFPLYRCNWDREASHRLALSVGFREVTTLAAVRFPDAV